MVRLELQDWRGESADVAEAVRRAASGQELRISVDCSLASYPGSRHWHLKREGESGILEVTHWPSCSRLWVSFHANRIGSGWVPPVARALALEMAKSLDGSVEETDIQQPVIPSATSRRPGP